MSQAVGFKDVHGYGKQLVENISVISRLEELGNALSVLDDKAKTGEGERERQEAEIQQARARHDELTVQDANATALLKAGLKSHGPITPELRGLAREQTSLRKELAGAAAKVARGERSLAKTVTKLDRTQAKADKYQQEAATIDGRREIFRNDVDLDSIMTLLKVGLVFLVTYVLREFLGAAAMAPATFLARVALLPARLHLTPQLEIVTFDYNQRDPDAMSLLATWAPHINERRLKMRSGRSLRIQVDPPPPPARPPPRTKRTNSSRWFTG